MTGPMISAVAWCPHPPLLVPQIAAGAAAETERLRAACAEAIGRLLAAGSTRLLVVGRDSPERGLRGFAPGVRNLPDADLPLSLAIGDWLLDRAGAQVERRFVAVAPDATPIALAPDATPIAPWPDATPIAPWRDATGTDPVSTGLLVMGDGSARRSVKGPGYLDARAEPFDAAVVAALAGGEAQVLAGLDLELAAELLVAGAAPWKAVALFLAERRWRGEVLYADAPYGVMYTVASWLPA